ncbi:MAG: hypothetical protein ABR603_01665 [Pyrinomonadaceae bacterium]
MGERNPNDLARKVKDEITSAGIRKVLKGESDVRLETLVVLAKALDTTAPLLLLEAMSSEEGENEGERVQAERAKIELYHIGELYVDIPRQCQKDVLDLLTVLQNNHSLSRRRERLIEHRNTVTHGREAALDEQPGIQFVPEHSGTLPGEVVVDPHLKSDQRLEAPRTEHRTRERKRA